VCVCVCVCECAVCLIRCLRRCGLQISGGGIFAKSTALSIYFDSSEYNLLHVNLADVPIWNSSISAGLRADHGDDMQRVEPPSVPAVDTFTAGRLDLRIPYSSLGRGLHSDIASPPFQPQDRVAMPWKPLESTPVSASVALPASGRPQYEQQQRWQDMRVGSIWNTNCSVNQNAPGALPCGVVDATDANSIPRVGGSYSVWSYDHMFQCTFQFAPSIGPAPPANASSIPYAMIAINGVFSADWTPDNIRVQACLLIVCPFPPTCWDRVWTGTLFDGFGEITASTSNMHKGMVCGLFISV